MKNCADSAAHAISIAATRMDGAVQKTEDGSTSRRAPADRRINTQTYDGGGAGNCARSRASARHEPLLKPDTRIPAHHRVFLELRTFHRKIRPEMRPPAFLARHGRHGDQQRYLMNVAKRSAFPRRLHCLTPGLFQTFDGSIEPLAAAHNSAPLPR